MIINGFAGLFLGTAIFYVGGKLIAWLFRNHKAKDWGKYAMTDKDFNEMTRKDRETENRLRFK